MHTLECGRQRFRNKSRFQLLALYWSLLLLPTACSLQPPDQAAEPTLNLDRVAVTDRTTVRELLRGFTDPELAEAQSALPERPDPPIEAPVGRQVQVRGKVFIDKNENGRVDTEESGFAQVVISDGERIIRTGADGAFSLSFQIEEEAHYRFVVATRPTGYQATTPFFLRIPFAENQTAYRVDFGFSPDPDSAKREFWFLTTSDSQFHQHDGMITTAKDYFQMTTGPDKPAFLITVGDLTSNGDHYQWDMYDQIRGASQVTVYDGFGGHDGNCLDPISTANFESRIGPPYGSWDYGGVHFIQLISEVNYLSEQAKKRQATWLQADLKAIPEGTPVVVSTHLPLPSEWFDARQQEGVSILCQLAGHWHTAQVGSRGGVPVMSAAPANGKDWGAFARVYRMVFVSPKGVRSELRVAGQYERLELVAPGPEAVLGSQPLRVLAYDSARTVTGVRCRMTSPSAVQSDLELRQAGDWTWQADFSPDEEGDWRFELTAAESSGLTWKRVQAVRVADIALAEPHAKGEFPWLLAGDPPRRVQEALNPPLYPLWVRHTGSVHVRHAAPAVSDGRLYVAITNPNAGAPGSGVLCLDAHTGRRLWQVDTPLGDIPGAVTVRQGYVYAFTAEGWVTALDARTGDRLWEKPLAPDFRLGRPNGNNYTMPTPTEEGLLIADWRRTQLLLDYRTGQVLGQPPANIQSSHFTPFCTVYDGILFSAQRDSRIAVGLVSGEVVWQKDDTLHHTSAGVLEDDKFIYTGCCSSENLPERKGNFVKAVDAGSGELLWETLIPNSIEPFLRYSNPVPVVWDELVLANGEDLIAIDLKAGTVQWRVEHARSTDWFAGSQRQVLGGLSSPLVAGPVAYFGHEDTSIRAVDKSGKVLWEYRVGTPIQASPAVSGNLLFVHDYAGNLWCFVSGSGKG